MNKIKYFFNFVVVLAKSHKLAIICAFLVGTIYVAPHLFFVVSLGGDYKGIPMMQTANEDTYLSRIHEISDGHPMVGSFSFFEYKNQSPLSPPVGEFFYALPSLIFGISLADTLIASRFILPVILFSLIYVLIRRLTGNLSCFSNKFNAAAGALWVALGYDLIDFRSVWNFLTGKQDFSAGSFLLWSRPVNPILGAIFLFSFLLLLWALWHKTRYRKSCVVFAGLFLALMIASYFFSWGMALSIWGVLMVIALAKKDWLAVKSFFGVLLSAFIFSSPYWYMSWQASQSPWYKDSVLRSGLFYTHYPLMNKLMLAVLAVYLILVGWSLFMKNRPFVFSFGYFKNIFNSFKSWQWFCLSFILGALWAYSQQIVTGVTVWPYHFVQYSIPLAIVAAMALLFNIIKEKSVYLWGGVAGLIIIASLSYGVYAQVSVYRSSASYYAGAQSYAEVFGWLNRQPKDCVVLVKQDAKEIMRLDLLIPAFTHCNNFISTDGVFSLMPNDRVLFNYLVFLRLNDVKPENIESYMVKNQREIRSRLSSNWKGLYGVKDFPDFSDKLLKERIKKFPQDYREFYAKDFRQVLSEYRLDYILSADKPLDNNLVKDLNAELLFEKNAVFVYEFNQQFLFPSQIF